MLKYHIQTFELTSAQSVISINNIPQEYNDLLVLVSSRTSSTQEHLLIGLNNSTSNFSGRFLAGSTVTGSGDYARYIGNQMPSGAPANTFSSASIYISNYQAPTPKVISGDITGYRAEFSFLQTGISANLWNNTAAINSIQFTNEGGTNFVAGTSVSLYGVRRGSDGVTSPVAQGGTVTTSGGYTIHTFNTSGTFTAFRPLECEYLVIAGGGGTHPDAMTSGGAGGYRSSVVGEMSGGGATAEPKISLLGQTSYPVLVGAGGSRSSKGSDSTFASITSIGGGSGESGYINTRINGGSGSGNILGQPAGTGVAGQGFAGGNGTMAGSSGTNGGGAGGAGQAGFAPVNNTSSGNGGSGVSSSITGSAVTRAGGGGGGYYTNTLTPDKSTGLGGAGGGGRGMFRVLADPGNPGSIDGQSGTANTGGGSGGGAPSYGSYVLNGGSGVVIIRYLTPA
jgi:hypothetical protein